MEIVEVSDVDLAFPANGWKLLPDRKLVEKFKAKDPAYEKWAALFTQLFFGGTPEDKKLELIPRKGTDSEKAWRMIRCAMGTYGCKHEHKSEGVAYMFNAFWSDYRWADEEPKPTSDLSRPPHEEASAPAS